MPAHLSNGAISRSSCAPLSITATTPASSASQLWRLRQPVHRNLAIHRGDRMPNRQYGMGDHCASARQTLRQPGTVTMSSAAILFAVDDRNRYAIQTGR